MHGRLRGGTYAVGALWISCASAPCSVPPPPRLSASPPLRLVTAGVRLRAAPYTACAPLRGGRVASQGPVCPSEAVEAILRASEPTGALEPTETL